MKKVLIIGGIPESLVNFRGDLIRRIVAQGHEVTAMSELASEDQVKKINSLGASFKSFPLQRNGLNPLRDARTLISIRRTYKEIKPDVVLAYTIKPVIWGGIALFGVRKTEYYALITGLGFAFQGEGLVRRLLTGIVSLLYRFSLSRSSSVIFQNSDDLDVFVSNKIVSKKKTHIVSGSGVDTSRYTPRKVGVEQPIFLTVTRLLEEKGIRIFASAAQAVKRIYPEAVFRILGPEDPSPDAIPVSEVLRWQEEGWVEYLGQADDVRPYLNECGVFVLASYYGEGLPRTIIEAMSSGKPILTTNNVGCRETVVPMENGLLVPVKDYKALADAMIWFIENTGEWLKMGQVSRLMAEKKFDMNIINVQMLGIMSLASSTGLNK